MPTKEQLHLLLEADFEYRKPIKSETKMTREQLAEKEYPNEYGLFTKYQRAAFIKGYEANQSLKEAKVFRICSHCDTEFELKVANTLTERISSFQNCTHCGKRNDSWISIRLKP